MALHLHRAPRTDQLADALGELLAVPLADPFATELVLVPAKGVERWLSQRLSHVLGRGEAQDGVCAGVEFRSPRSLVAELMGTTYDDPWAPDALTWPLLAVLDDSLDAPWAQTLARHLGHLDSGDEAEFRRGRRYSVARRLAGLFSSYAVQRPQLLVDWLEGRPTDGAGGELAADLSWQPPLWRALVAAVGQPPPHVRHAETVARLEAGPSDLPPRISLFGHTRMASTEIALLAALATHHDLHLWLPHPSDDLWQALRDARGVVSRADDRSHRRVGHPLLATLGRDVRELERSLAAVDATDTHHGDPPAPATMLGWLQDDLRANAVRPDGRALDAADRSVQVHSCHGAARQVDVLREVLLGLLDDDPTLEPRDILVMCPDIETYAPLISAGFGLGDLVEGGHPAHRLRVRLADRALTQTNPLLGVAAQLLDLAGGRTTASRVLDLVQAPPVRRRFGLSDDDLDAITAWVRESGIRWGLDKEHRAPYGVDFIQNTWQFGLDRVLVGVALSDDSQGWLGTTLPLDDVGSNRVELAGRFAELLGRLSATVDALTGTRPLGEWLSALADGVAALTKVDRNDQWQTGQVQRELAQVLADASARQQTPLRLSDVRALLGAHLAGRPTRANFRTGGLTVATLVPMRSVPHRVVCLLGLDDGIFPRLGLVDGDDVLARTPLTGERDVRSEDRQLLLDAVGAATETLVVTYTGANEHSGQPRPPAVPLGELLDALDRTTPEPVRDRLVVEHPLQPFDPRNVTPGSLGTPTPFTFDPTLLVAARTAVGDRPAAPPFLPAPLAPAPADDIALADLVGFLKDPVKGFFRALDLTLPWDVDGVADAMPVEIDALETWGVGDRMLADMLRGIHPDQALGAEWRRGALPPGQLGWRKAGEIRDAAMQLAVAALTHRQVAPKAYDVDVRLDDGRRITGTVGPVYGDRLVAVGYSRLDARQLIESWVRLLALAAHDPDHNWTALTIGRAARGSRPAQRLLGPAIEEPLSLLTDLVRLYDAGRREPLPLPLKTSFAWASARLNGDDPREQAGRRWKSGMYPAEDADPAQSRVWGDHAPLGRLLGPPAPGEETEGEDTRLGAYAVRLWLPLLRSERAFS
ncbi:exodeoxyribonuclease V subunit gamma [Nocardioides sp. URHA0020]|uniref:exodeoxyribonuclease V subunit gamma n=1 Tax=Nocardioides sp. URHA0020 TaxID=1380392 RepID=UPI0004906399|nr:exodeoxyribonuclease V subunit gamma [Nocardioides sp. URHA0020]